MSIIFGSARLGSNGKITGDKPGDNNGKEISTQDFYVHSKGWYILRAKSPDIATKIAKAMKLACDNNNIGYNQNKRLGIITNGVNSKVKTDADCSSTVRACCIYAGFDPGNFTTADEIKVLSTTNMFESKIKYVNDTKTPLYTGDILVTCTKGHTGVIVSGNSRTASKNNGADYSLVFDADFYFNNYADIRNAIGRDKNKLLNHFKSFGMKEGRQAIKTFNVYTYKNTYADLRQAFGEDLTKYYEHYITNGYKEGRKGY